MGTKMVRLTEDAYSVLKSMKSDSESFSDVIRRICNYNPVKLLDLAGILDADEAREIDEFIKSGREKSDRRVEAIESGLTGDDGDANP